MCVCVCVNPTDLLNPNLITSKLCRSLVDPTDLREALDMLPNHNFKLGEMNDPSEVLSAIYECLGACKELNVTRCGRCWACGAVRTS